MLIQPYFIQSNVRAALFTASTSTNKRSPNPARSEQDGVSNSAQAPAGHSSSATSEPIPVGHRNAAAEKHIAIAVPEPVQERTREHLKGWRLYVLIFAAPAGVLATGLIIFSMPNHFPNIQGSAASSSFRAKFSRASFARLDIMGATLLLFSSVLIVFAFEEAGARYGWVSPAILSSLTIGASLFVAFLVWERVAFFTGPPFMTVLINLPQRFQAVDGTSAFETGLRLLPLLLASPVATAVSGQLAGRFKIPPFYLLLFATSLQLVGVGLASSVKSLSGKEMYGYEAIMGFGFGMGLVSLLIFTPMVVDRTDMGVAMGAITQMRVLGGTIGLAISATLLNNHVNPRLATLLTPEQLRQISESVGYINTLPDSTRDATRQIFADGYNAQMRAMLYFNVVVFISAIVLWERKPRSAATIQGL
ncbi:hypothetical protein DL766_000042 [Monosporascus sp. MC13-8B]|uniref:Major facilitator superfamily (MFS) profile domain-containing protein n=1 Tax=Monosporascus cannonballus TaxID=155416 RepID=A0ABY0HJA8_9PEZI|nr:hypothetical protein DL762_000411 [Monosporascus cannonballus]RYP01186.1 hypothetical protein DL763_000311 [Monosporascus cannonballus]RYP40241.1 hypothetical protein DL766_000042 [Monosporascus sp. MC13-8B]